MFISLTFLHNKILNKKPIACLERIFLNCVRMQESAKCSGNPSIITSHEFQREFQPVSFIYTQGQISGNFEYIV